LALRKIFGHEEKEVRGKRRKLHSEELCGFHFPPDIIRVIKDKKIRRDGYVARMERGASWGRMWGRWGNLGRKRPLVRQRRRWKHNIKVNYKGI
jgi:hypothetical protein